MKEEDALAKAPQRSGTELVGSGCALRDDGIIEQALNDLRTRLPQRPRSDEGVCSQS